MRESVNQVNIEGLISEIRINDLEKNGKKYISGEVIVKVNDKDGLESFVPVSFISADKKKDGTPNKIYQNLQDLKNYKSIANAGVEAADMVQIRGAKVGENMFIPKGSSEVVVGKRISSNFFNRIQKQNFNPEATFTSVIYILKMEDETRNENGEPVETGRLIIKGALVGYGDKVEVVDYIVENPKNIEFIRANYKNGDTVRIGGKLNYSEEIVTVEREVGFGEAEERTFTRRKREFVVLRGSAGPLEEEESYQEADIKQALADRMARQQALKDKQKTQTQTSEDDFGF